MKKKILSLFLLSLLFSNINDDINQEIENIIPFLDNKLSLATWKNLKIIVN